MVYVFIIFNLQLELRESIQGKVCFEMNKRVNLSKLKFAERLFAVVHFGILTDLKLNKRGPYFEISIFSFFSWKRCKSIFDQFRDHPRKHLKFG